jgi:hypothetical protein
MEVSGQPHATATSCPEKKEFPVTVDQECEGPLEPTSMF